MIAYLDEYYIFVAREIIHITPKSLALYISNIYLRLIATKYMPAIQPANPHHALYVHRMCLSVTFECVRRKKNTACYEYNQNIIIYRILYCDS